MTAHHDSSALDDDSNELALFQDVVLSVGTILDLSTLLRQLAARAAASLPCDCCVILAADDENLALHFGAANTLPEDPQTRGALETLSISLYNTGAHPVIGGWLAGRPQPITQQNAAEHPELQWLLKAFKTGHLYGFPLLVKDQLNGVILAGTGEGSTTPPDFAARATAIARAAAVAVHNARIYSRTVLQAETHMRELTILRQIDRELNDTIEPQHVFQMTLDWALRFTNAHAASIGLYDQETDEFRIITTYGYDIPQEQLALVRMQRGGIAQRVARSGYAELIPDVSLDKDFIRGASLTLSQMSVPVMREDRVIAVISVESRKINGFTEEHQDFVEKLAARAGVAIDNARLFDTTAREREKLSHILNTIADVVIAFGLDERLILMNPAAYAALRLYPHENYIGRRFDELLVDTDLLAVYQRAQASSDLSTTAEVVVPNGRTYHLNMTRQENVGWIIVMHDITPFKEMDLLKSELIATVSHDLKQPLAVMNGYIELLMMHRKLDETGIDFLEMVRKSIQSMRQLIDDLLDLAKIESGIRLDLQPVDVRELVGECVNSLQPAILSKAMHISTEITSDLPMLWADRARLQQILLNLISNAVKYTQPEGQVQVTAESRDAAIRIAIQDNGMGISPEDQTHIFERFFRVRRPETDSIEGTGLGLAIVKSLVEAHKGNITLESRLGEGTTFILSLPTAPQDEAVMPPAS
jgi:signal transduction histidine kinase